jgi:hypothetical protein
MCPMNAAAMSAPVLPGESGVVVYLMRFCDFTALTFLLPKMTIVLLRAMSSEGCGNACGTRSDDCNVSTVIHRNTPLGMFDVSCTNILNPVAKKTNFVTAVQNKTCILRKVNTTLFFLPYSYITENPDMR